MVFLPAVRAAQGGSENTEIHSTASSIAPITAPAGPGPSSTASSSRFAKPVGSMPPPHGPVIRKQNIACDACRTRKIRCQRTTIEQTVRFTPIVRQEDESDVSASNVRPRGRSVHRTMSSSWRIARIRRKREASAGARARLRMKGRATTDPHWPMSWITISGSVMVKALVVYVCLHPI